MAASPPLIAPATGAATPPMASPAAPGMMNQAGDPLAALRDIHTPAMIEAWPPAIGWWILAATTLIALLTAVIWLWRRWRANRYRREALMEMDQLLAANRAGGDDREYLVGLQQLLKRVALTKFPREAVAGLTGEAWLNFLDHSSNSHAFSIGPAEALIDGNYRPDTEIDVTALDTCARQWINQHNPDFLIAEITSETVKPPHAQGQLT